MKMVRHLAGLLPAAIFFTAFVASGQDSGRIQGRVLGEDGLPVDGATVAYTRVRANGPVDGGRRYAVLPGETSFSGAVRAASDGSFDAGGLVAGHYRLCVVAPGHLDPCDWFGSAHVALPSGSVRSVRTISLKRAALLRIRLNDPARLLPLKQDLTRNPLILGVLFGQHWFRTPRLVATDSGGRDLELAVPYDAPLKLWLFSREFRVKDERGAVLNNRGEAYEFRIPSGVAERRFVLNLEAGGGE